MADARTSLAWKVLAWLAAFVGLGVGIRWYSHTPTLGYAGLALAMGATLMPLFWEKVGVLCKMLWVSMLFLLLAVEYRAIDKDRKHAADDLAERFGKITTQANSNLKQILEDEHASFAKLLKEEDTRFSQTMEAIISSQRQNDQEFAVLLKQQRDIFDKQNEMIESLNGRLLPGNDPLPSTVHCPPDFGGSYSLMFGNFVRKVGTFPFVPFQLTYNKPSDLYKGLLIATDYKPIVIDKSPDGLLIPLIDIRGKDGKIVVKIDGNGFEVAPSFFRLHPNKSTLIVQDQLGKDVLTVRYLNRQVLKIDMQLVVEGEAIADTSALGNVCLPQGFPIELDVFKQPQ